MNLIIGNLNQKENSEQNKEDIKDGVNFNEWGALLFYDQILLIVKLFEETILSLINESVKPCFTILLWGIKILTLDRPVDIKRCGIIPTKYRSEKRYIGDCGWYYLDENQVKQIIRRRVDFSKEVINNLKLDIENNNK